MRQKRMKNEQRTLEQIREHYEIEKDLANQLRNALKQARHTLYSSLYDELYQRVPHHPQLLQKSSPAVTAHAVRGQMRYLKPFLDKESTFLEIGPGDCALSFEVSKFVRRVYAVDVSTEVTKARITPQNFQLILSNGSAIPLPPHCVNIAYSNQLMEHLHPEDALEQLQEIYNALAPGGLYICITPNRLTGPHDVSQYFDTIATGFHLKEYTITELSQLFRKVGFTKTKIYVAANRMSASFPLLPFVLCEKLLCLLPHVLRKQIVRISPFRMLLNIRLIGIK